MKHEMRKYEGTTRLQGVGVVEGIRAINVRVGDRRVWNFGDSTEVIRVELSKTGKTVKITTKYFNKRARLEEGQWIGEWQEDTRTLKADTIVVVTELNPATKEEVEEVKEEEVKPVEEMTFEEKAVKASEIVNNDAFKVEKEQAVTLYLQGVRIYGREFEDRIKHSVYSLVRNVVDNTSDCLCISYEEAMETLLNSSLNQKTIDEIRELCKANIEENYEFNRMEKWEMILLLHCCILEGNKTLTIQDDIINNAETLEVVKSDHKAPEEVKPIKVVPEQINKIKRLITAINEVNPLLDELNEAMEDIMYDNNCNDLGVSQLIKDFYTSVTCSGFLEDFESVAKYDLKQLKK